MTTFGLQFLAVKNLSTSCYFMKHWWYKVCLFVLFIAAWAIFQLSGGCHHYRWLGCKFRPMLGAQGLWAGRNLYRANTYCDTGPQFKRSHPKDRHPRPTVGFEPPTQGPSDLWARRSIHCATRTAWWYKVDNYEVHIKCTVKYCFLWSLSAM